MILHSLIAALVCTGTGTGAPAAAVGAPAPAFQAACTDGTTNTLAMFKGRWLVLCFYPKSFTPGCTKEVCALRDGYQAIQKLDAVVRGVSFDPMDKQNAFKAQYNLPFELLSDEDKSIARAFDAVGLFGLAPQRKTFIIAPDGAIAHVFDRVNVADHDKEIAAALEQCVKKAAAPAVKPPGK